MMSKISRNEIRLRSIYLLKTNKKETRIKFIDAVLISLFPHWTDISTLREHLAANIYLFKVGVFIVKFEHISHLFLVFLLLTLKS